MAIKFSQFVVETDKANVNYLVGWDGAENVQITPADLLSTFASGSGTTGFIPKWTSSSNLGDSILEVNSALPDDVLMPRYIRHSGDTNTSFGFPSNDTFVVSTSGSEVMRVTSAGSVGIGTTSPVSKLQVEGSFISSGISQLGSSGVNVYLTSSSAGNVGVGTSSPSEKLEVVGNVKINGTGNTQLILESGGPCDVDLLNAQSEAYLRTTTAHDLYFRTTNLNRMVIKAAGNVGIGTTAPGNKLHVNGGEIQVVNGQTGKLLLQNSNNYLYGDQNGVGIFNANNNLRLYTVGSERIRITSAGNVGIGTTSPSHKLEVNGNIQATGTAFISSSFDANHYMRIESNSSGGILKGADGGVITTLVRTYGDSYFNGGNVGIGTTTPDYKLEVQGVISSADAGLQKATFANVVNDLVLTANADATNVTAKMLFKSSGSGGGAVSEKMSIQGDGNVVIGGYLTPASSGVTYTSLLQLQKGFNTSNEPDVVLKINNLSSATTAGTGGSKILFEADEPGNGNGDGAKRHSIESTYFGGVENWKIYSGTNFDNLYFATGGIFAMAIDENQRVRIGTTNNAGVLNVGGPILASDNGQTAGMYVRRTLDLSHPGNTGTFTRTFNPVTQFGISRLGGNVLLEVSGWSQRVNCGYIQFQNAGGGGNLTTVSYTQIAVSGNGSISVSINSANNNSIDINFSGWHGNGHAWQAKIITQ